MRAIIYFILASIVLVGCGKVRDKKEDKTIPSEIVDYIGNVQLGSWWKYENQWGEIDSSWASYSQFDENFDNSAEDIGYTIYSDIDLNITAGGYYVRDLGFEMVLRYGNTAIAVPFYAEYRDGQLSGHGVEYLDSIELRNGDVYYNVLKIFDRFYEDNYVILAKDVGIVRKQMDGLVEYDLIDYENLPN